jgi:ABC-type multidrug transport system ATPase subunit
LPATREGVRIAATSLRKTVKGGRCVLDDVSFVIEPGELVAIAGGSGAGKTMLLEALAGSRPADSGSVLFDGVDVYERLDVFRTVLGYVPQDDIIHLELPLKRTLLYAARLRLPSAASRREVDAAVEEALLRLGLAEHAHVRVGALSGGQRKRASIAVELLTHPHVFFLDEPTSGLDPATGVELLKALRELAHEGSTVVFTTHAVQDLVRCDRVVFLASGGRVAFVGSIEDALSPTSTSKPSKKSTSGSRATTRLAAGRADSKSARGIHRARRRRSPPLRTPERARVSSASGRS